MTGFELRNPGVGSNPALPTEPQQLPHNKHLLTVNLKRKIFYFLTFGDMKIPDPMIPPTM